MEKDFKTEGKKMIVMKEHNWLDVDISHVKMGEYENIRKIFIESGTTILLISKSDVIALAKEFNLVVYEKDLQL